MSQSLEPVADELHVRLIGGHGWQRERQIGHRDPAGRVDW